MRQEWNAADRYSPYSKLELIGLWGWYIDTTLTILEIIRHPVFYLELNLTL
jgi:hypothetical protein